jgi:ABC-type siderophore export system fused ATPase/permease subunit
MQGMDRWDGLKKKKDDHSSPFTHNSTAFVSIVLFGMLRDPLNVVPQAFMAYSDTKTSLGHITAFLNTEMKMDDHDDDMQETRIGFLETSLCKWPSVDFVLNVPPLVFKQEAITLVTGPCQSGKTSLLLALLGDMPLLTGKVISLFLSLSPCNLCALPNVNI